MAFRELLLDHLYRFCSIHGDRLFATTRNATVNVPVHYQGDRLAIYRHASCLSLSTSRQIEPILKDDEVKSTAGDRLVDISPISPYIDLPLSHQYSTNIVYRMLIYKLLTRAWRLLSLCPSLLDQKCIFLARSDLAGYTKGKDQPWASHLPYIHTVLNVRTQSQKYPWANNEVLGDTVLRAFSAAVANVNKVKIKVCFSHFLYILIIRFSKCRLLAICYSFLKYSNSIAEYGRFGDPDGDSGDSILFFFICVCSLPAQYNEPDYW